jgi:hypothetical protein
MKPSVFNNPKASNSTMEELTTTLGTTNGFYPSNPLKQNLFGS